MIIGMVLFRYVWMWDNHTKKHVAKFHDAVLLFDKFTLAMFPFMCLFQNQNIRYAKQTYVYI